jgi:hypothetical protein
MNVESASTAPKTPLDEQSLGLTGLKRSVAVVALQLAAATTPGLQRRLLGEYTAGTQTIEVLAESSTQMRKASPEVQARLDLMLNEARSDIIEDGRTNAITDQLAELFLRDYNAVVPLLAALIENGRTPPILAAELLKELGRIRDAASHDGRRWLLLRALSASSPFVRDGAGLGLARLADPVVIRHLRRSVAAEPNAEIREDLQLVLDELAETVADGTSPAGHL